MNIKKKAHSPARNGNAINQSGPWPPPPLNDPPPPSNDLVFWPREKPPPPCQSVGGRSSSSLAVCRSKLLCHVDEKYKTCCRARPAKAHPSLSGGIWTEMAWADFFYSSFLKSCQTDDYRRFVNERKRDSWGKRDFERFCETWQGIEFFNIISWLVSIGLTLLGIYKGLT